MPFQYRPHRNTYVGSITDLMGRGRDAEAQALITAANAQAQAAQLSAQAWGGAIQGIGNTVAQGITDWNSPEARRQRWMDRAIEVAQSGAADQRSVTVPDVINKREGVPLPRQSLLDASMAGLNLFSPEQEAIPPSTRNLPLPTFGQQPPPGGPSDAMSSANESPSPTLGPIATGVPIDVSLGPRAPFMQPFADRPSEGQIGQRELLDDSGEPVMRGRYTLDNGQYDSAALLKDLIAAGIPLDVANEFAAQGVKANTILAEGADIGEQYRKSQLKVQGVIAGMALTAIELGVSPEDAVNQATPAGEPIPAEQMRQFRVLFHQKTRDEQVQILKEIQRRATDTEFGQGLYDVTLADGSVISGASQVDAPEGRSYIGPNGEPLEGIKSVTEQRYNPLGEPGYELGGAESGVDFANFDPSTRNMLQHAGLNLNEMLVAIGQTSRLPRGWRRDRAISGANQWFADKGIDPSTMAAEFDAYNDALRFNVRKFNLVRNAETEIYEDIQNLRQVIDRLGLSEVLVFNQIKAWGLGQVTDPRASEYLFLINQLQNDLTMYNQASQGGGTQAPTDALRNEAKEMIKAGASQGTLEGLLGGLERSIAGMTVVNQGALNRTRQRVWALFGVGDKYQPVESGVPEIRERYVPPPGAGDGGIELTIQSDQAGTEDTVFDPNALPAAVRR